MDFILGILISGPLLGIFYYAFFACGVVIALAIADDYDKSTIKSKLIISISLGLILWFLLSKDDLQTRSENISSIIVFLYMTRFIKQTVLGLYEKKIDSSAQANATPGCESP